MSTHPSPSEQITAEVTSWPGVTAGPGSRGEFAFTVGRRSASDLHVSGADIEHHPIFPDKRGPAARRIAGADDVGDVIALLRLNYDRAVDRHGLPEHQPAA